jgi:hypothetical protein
MVEGTNRQYEHQFQWKMSHALLWTNDDQLHILFTQTLHAHRQARQEYLLLKE